MSLILDALKRAERERAAERNPALADLPAAASRTPRRRSPWRRRAVLVIALLSLGAAAVWFTRHIPPPGDGPVVAPPSPAPESTQAPAPSSPAPAAAERAESPPPVAAAEPDIVPGTETVTSLDELTAETEPAPTAPMTGDAELPAPAKTPPAAESDDAEEAGAPDQDAPPEDGPPATAPLPDSRPVPQALTQPAPRRRLREMPPEYRADFPALSIDVHVYERSAARRFTIVNGRRYREGERLSEGPLLIEIVREGLVVEHRGERVLLPLNR